MVTGENCTWPISYAGCSDYPPEDESEEHKKDRLLFERMAIDFLNSWTGDQFGTCPVVLRPCRRDCPPGSGTSTFWGNGPFPTSSTGGWQPVIIGGSWYNIRCGTCRMDTCTCGHGDVIELPGPIVSIEQVTVDGQVLSGDGSAYRVDNASLLVRTDGGTWPRCQDLDDPLTEEGTWQVQYTRGTPVPVGGQLAAGRLARELELAYCAPGDCALPRRVTDITRQGVSVGIAIDTFEDIKDGRTGIWAIDGWVASVTSPAPRATVRSPDIPRIRERVQTWPALT